MRVSVIIPHYNMADYLGRAVRSVRAQGDMVKELVVVDDGSEEDEWLRAMQACHEYEFDSEGWYRYEENRGQAHALNDALDSVLADYKTELVDAIAFLDADDEWTDGKLEKQIAALEADPSIDMVFGYAHEVEVIGPGETFYRRAKPAPLLSALLIRRDSMVRAGMFEENLGAGTMVEWLDRAQRLGLKSHMLTDTVYIRHVHGKNYGIVHRDGAREEYARAIRIIEERKRAP